MMDRDTWFTAERAKEFGLIDEIVTRKPAEETLSSPGIEPPK
jgi:ATP-dependent protease ClpP protease subunit